MARQVLPIVGAIVGSYFGAPQLGYMIGSLVGNAVDPQVLKGPRIGDLSVQTSRDGVPRPIIFGTVSVTGNVIDRGQYVITTDSEQQGKGGPVIESERVSLTFAIRICEGPIGGIARIWEDEKLVYDVRPESIITEESGKFAENMAIYLGGESQLPDPSLEAIHGVGTTPAYRGSAYVVFTLKDLTDRRGSIPNYRFEAVSENTAPDNGDFGYWWLIESDSATADRQKIWFSYDLETWSPAASADGYTRTTNTADPQWSINFCGKNVVINSGDNYDIISDLTPPNPITSTSQLLSYDALNRPFFKRDLVFPKTAYSAGSYTLNGGVTMAKIVQPSTSVLSGGQLYGLTRTSSGRWYGWGGGSTGNEFVYSDFSSPANWTNLGLLPSSASIKSESHSMDSGVLVMVCVSTLGRIYRSINNGLSWTLVQTIAEDCDIVRHIQSDGTWFISTLGGTSCKIYRSQDAGVSFQVVETGTALGGILPNQPSQINFGNGLITLCCDRTIFYSSDGGDTWQEAGFPTDSGADNISLTYIGSEFYDLTPVSGDPYPLDDIVTFCCNRVGVESAQIDVSELTDLVAGFVIGGPYSAAEAIRSLQRAYFFDAGEWDAVLHFPKRGHDVIETITEDDLLEDPEDATREQEIEYPKKMHLSYQDARLGYVPTKQTVTRSSPDVRVVNEVSVEVPVVLEADEAAQVVDKLMKIAWVDVGGEVKIKVPDNKCYWTPTDCINVRIRDKTTRVRIERIDTADGILSVQARHDRISSYTSDATGALAPEPLDPVSSIPGVTFFEFINSPALIDRDDRLGYYIAVSGERAAWAGTSVQRSEDGGSSYYNLMTITRPSVMGRIIADIPAASEFSLDTTNTIRVQILGERSVDLNSIPYTEMLKEKNAIIIGDEIMQYQDAVEESPGIWALTTIIRGRLQTTPEAHTAGERFVLLEGVHFIETNSSLVGTTLTHRATSFSNSPEDSTAYSDVWSPALSQVEFTPSFLTLERDLFDVITGSWSPRFRFGTDVVPIASVNDRGFRISLSDGVDTVVMPDQTASTFSYDASALGPSVTVSVGAVNRITDVSPYVSGII